MSSFCSTDTCVLSASAGYGTWVSAEKYVKLLQSRQLSIDNSSRAVYVFGLGFFILGATGSKLQSTVCPDVLQVQAEE